MLFYFRGEEMSIEEQLKSFVLSKYKSIREFSILVDMPYSTIDSIFKRGIGNAGVTNIITICNKLNLDVDKLAGGILKEKSELDNHACPTACTPKEQNIIEKYRVLDDRGKQTVCDALDREYSYISKKREYKLRNGKGYWVKGNLIIL